MEKGKAPAPVPKPRLIAAGILTVLFLTAITAVGTVRIAQKPRAAVNSVKYYKAKEYLADPEDTGFFSMTRARIASLEAFLGRGLICKEELQELNASLQYASGKRMIVAGDGNMLRLDNGQLYYMTQVPTLKDKAEEVVEFCRQAGVPVLLSYIHPGFSNGCQQLPPGYAEIDTGDELADEFIATIRGAGLDILDSRTFFEGTGLTEDELWLKTDKHWTSLAELLATGIYAERISEMTGVPIDPALFDPASFTTVVYPENFIGTYGEQAGRRNIVPDDITAFVPRYETDITRHSEQRDDRVDDVSGPFEVSVIRQSLLELDDGKPNETGYLLYGLLEAYEELVNHGPCADLTLLVFRDSYSEPICSFLSLGVKRVVSVDLRYYQGTAMEVVRQVQPDLVVFSFSRLMYEADQYDLGLEDVPGDGA